MRKRWQLLKPDPQTVEKIRNGLGCHPVVATLLANRGLASSDAATRFMNATIHDIRAPFPIKDVDTATTRIYQALRHNEKIIIFGDYDVDGVTATVTLYSFLRNAGAHVSYYIPHRVDEGYGLKPDSVMNIARPGGSRLIVTADCGTGSHEGVKTARQCGIDVIITDHHQTDGTLPDALAVVNPRRPDCTAGFENLAGVGVAFYLLIALRKYLRDRNYWRHRPEPDLKSYYDLFALGTIADMVPLTGENRILAAAGINRIRSTRIRPGLQALLDVSRIEKERITAQDIAFQLAPRINAAGRMHHGGKAVDLLTTQDDQTAYRIATELDELNARRKKTEAEILDEIRHHVNQHPDAIHRKAVVFARKNWHEGVLGIVAAKMTEQYLRPAAILSIQGKYAKGSARSIPDFDLYAALMQCAAYLETFGGHPMAAGLSLKTENIDAFHKAFETVVQSSSKAADAKPVLEVDRELSFDEISAPLIDAIDALGPFGNGNPEPVFASRDIVIRSARTVGDSHRRMVLQQPCGSREKTFQAIHFNAGQHPPAMDRLNQIAYRLQWNYWNHTRTIQMVIEDMDGG